jgi:hypothetical protein
MAGVGVWTFLPVAPGQNIGNNDDLFLLTQGVPGSLHAKERRMPRMVITHLVEDANFWASQEQHEVRVKVFAPFGTECVSYVEDGSSKVAFAVNVHDMEGLMAFTKTPEAAVNMKRGGVIQPVVFHIEANPE